MLVAEKRCARGTRQAPRDGRGPDADRSDDQRGQWLRQAAWAGHIPAMYLAAILREIANLLVGRS
jgi:hypothetical protein